MRWGIFEEDDSIDGQKVYRLKWQPEEPSESRKYNLSAKEVLCGLFIRYLISRGKLSEFTISSEQQATQ